MDVFFEMLILATLATRVNFSGFQLVGGGRWGRLDVSPRKWSIPRFGGGGGMV